MRLPCRPAPAAYADPFAPLDDFIVRSAQGDSTRGLGAAQQAAGAAMAAGGEAVEWGAAAGSFAPGVGPALGGTMAARDAGRGDWAGAVLNAAGAAAGLKGIAGEADDAARAARLPQTAQTPRSFASFSAFKRAMGPAGEGKVWHHIVEQSQIDRFGPEAIHNADNIVAVSADVNIRLNALYSSIRLDITHSTQLTVRAWLRTKTFDEATEFGQLATEKVIAGIWP